MVKSLFPKCRAPDPDPEPALQYLWKKITLQVLKKTKKRAQNFETFTSSLRALCCFNIVLTEIQSADTVAGIRIQMEISLRVFKF